MNKPYMMFVVVLAVVVAAVLGVMWVMGSITMDQFVDVGWKAGAILAIALVAGLVVGMLGKSKS